MRNESFRDPARPASPQAAAPEGTAAAAAAPKPFDDVIRLYKAGLSQDFIVRKIGRDGIVYRLPPGAKEATECFQADGELHVTALALGPKGTLYAGSAADGRIYRIEPDGTWEVFFDPECAYVWALALDASGNLYAATGDEGKIWKITPSGEGSIWHDSSEINVTVLIPDGKGNFLAGGDGGATLFRLGPDGTPFVLWDSSLRLITSLALGPDGSVYASAVSAPARKPEEEKKISKAR